MKEGSRPQLPPDCRRRAPLERDTVFGLSVHFSNVVLETQTKQSALSQEVADYLSLSFANAKKSHERVA